GYPQKQFSLPMLFVVGYTYAFRCGCLSGFLQQQLVYFDPDTAYVVFFSRASLSAPSRLPKSYNPDRCWGSGALERWVSNASLHYSINPALQSFLRRREAIERNEA